MSRCVRRPSGMTRLRNYFLTGFIVCAPLAITAYIAWSVIGWVDAWVKPYIPAATARTPTCRSRCRASALIVALILITLIGFLTANIVGRAIVNFGECLLAACRSCAASTGALKQIFETVLSNKGDMFRQVGLVEYPRKGVWSIVFIAGETETEIKREARSAKAIR